MWVLPAVPLLESKGCLPSAADVEPKELKEGLDGHRVYINQPPLSLCSPMSPWANN